LPLLASGAQDGLPVKRKPTSERDGLVGPIFVPDEA
jgi:hypothetical protein